MSWFNNFHALGLRFYWLTVSHPQTHKYRDVCPSGLARNICIENKSYWVLATSLVFIWLATVKYGGDRPFILFRSLQSFASESSLLQPINCKQSHVSLSVLPRLFEICVCFPGGLIRQTYVICCNLAAVIQLTGHLCCGLISAQAFKSWQTKYIPQFCFWERFPGSSVLGMVSFIISVDNLFNPCSAVTSGALSHTFAFIVHLYHSFISVTKSYKLVSLFFLFFWCRVFTFLHFHLQFITMFINSEFLFLFYLPAKHITKIFFPLFLTQMPVLMFISLCHDSVTILRNRPNSFITENHAKRNIVSIWIVISNFEQALGPDVSLALELDTSESWNKSTKLFRRDLQCEFFDSWLYSPLLPAPRPTD